MFTGSEIRMRASVGGHYSAHHRAIPQMVYGFAEILNGTKFPVS